MIPASVETIGRDAFRDCASTIEFLVYPGSYAETWVENNELNYQYMIDTMASVSFGEEIDRTSLEGLLLRAVLPSGTSEYTMDDHTNYVFLAEPEDEITVLLYNLYGDELAKRTMVLEKGNNTLMIDQLVPWSALEVCVQSGGRQIKDHVTICWTR